MRTICVFILSLLLLCAGCQPTPEVDAVKQKNTNQLIEAVKEAEQEQQAEAKAGEPAPSPVPVKELMPERFQCDFLTEARQVHVQADVPIRVLTEGTFPLIRVQRRQFTNEERLTVYQRLFDSETVYKYEYRPSKAAVVREIEWLLQEPTAEEKKEFLEDPEESEETWAAYLQSRKDRIEMLRQKYLSLPDDGTPLPFEPWDGALFTIRNGESPGMVAGVEYPTPMKMPSHGTLFEERPVDYSREKEDGSDTYSVFSFDKRLDKPNVERIAPEDYGKAQTGAVITARQAAEAAMAPFVGLGDFAVADILWSHDADDAAVAAGKIGKQAYLVRLTPVLQGASMPYCDMDAMDIPEDGGYTPSWCYEHVIAAVDGDGTILGMAWEGPLQETEVVSDTTTLLPYEEVMDIFARQVNRIFSYEEDIHGSLTVSNVQLGLFRIREQGDMESGLLVPVWFITGEYRCASHPEEVRLYDSLSPVAVINAIDGSIIDVMKGY